MSKPGGVRNSPVVVHSCGGRVVFVKVQWDVRGLVLQLATLEMKDLSLEKVEVDCLQKG